MATRSLEPKHRPRKRFGQNFLTDTHVINNIIAAVNVDPNDHLIEIGPGLGALTDVLIKRCQSFTAIEIDRDLADILGQRYAAYRQFSLYRGDALQTNFGTIAAEYPVRVIGNLPYNISTPLLFHLIKFRNSITDMYFMLQKEVVDRLAAVPGNKNYGRLSVMVQYHCQVQALFEVPPTAFTPAPKVTSAVVRLTPHVAPAHHAEDLDLFERVVKTCFQQRRKTLRNSLKVFTEDPATKELISLDSSHIDLSARPETLSVADFVYLANLLGKPA